MNIPEFNLENCAWSVGVVLVPMALIGSAIKLGDWIGAAIGWFSERRNHAR